MITIVATAHRRTVPCPLCGTLARRIHSRYTRTLADLPWHGVQVRLELHVRKFWCDVPGCPRRIFTERFAETTAPYARRTTRAATALELIGFALGGRPGARLAHALGLAGGAWAILERVREAAERAAPTPRVLGVDDWALCRGQRYGTVLVDLERRCRVDLLPDREAETFAAWLRAHPGVEFIARDRGGTYAEGARQGAPNAIQIADRFHLLQNLMAALEHACTRHHAALRSAAELTHPKPLAKEETRQRRYSGLPHNRAGPTKAEQRGAERRARRRARYEQVVALASAGMPKKRIARTLGLARRTVITWLAAGHFPERQPRVRRPHRLDPYATYIMERYVAGLDNAAQLARELRARGYTGPDQTVGRYLAEMRRTRPRSAAGPLPPQRHSAPTPSPRATAWLLRNADAKPATLTAEERTYVEVLGTDCPALARARALATEFVQMLKRHDPNALAPWLAEAEESELRAFAHGLRRDQDAVLAATLFPWSNGQVEGQVNRLKLLKRSMYGRSGFALLRQRVLHAA